MGVPSPSMTTHADAGAQPRSAYSISLFTAARQNAALRPLRRQIFAMSWVVLAMTLITPRLSAAAAPARTPNFLFVYTDDQRWDAMSVVQREQGDKARFPWFQTPYMDRIAAEGLRFRNA